MDRPGIRNVKNSPKRAALARDLGKKVGVDIKQVFLTTGDSDLILIVDAADGANVAKFCMTLGAMGNVRTETVRLAGSRIHEDYFGTALASVRARDFGGVWPPCGLRAAAGNICQFGPPLS